MNWSISAFVVVALSLWFSIAWRNTKKQIARTSDRRKNPSRDEFRAMLADDVSPETAEFLWETMIVYLEPKLTPHPEDHLVKDLPIDDGDWSMDWVLDFADKHGLDHKAWPYFPEGWEPTVRNFALWLEMGLPQEPSGSV